MAGFFNEPNLYLRAFVGSISYHYIHNGSYYFTSSSILTTKKMRSFYKAPHFFLYRFGNKIVNKTVFNFFLA